MASMIELIIRLEKRIFILEAALGVEADKENFTHPKALKQAICEAEALKVQLGEIK